MGATGQRGNFHPEWRVSSHLDCRQIARTHTTVRAVVITVYCPIFHVSVIEVIIEDDRAAGFGRTIFT